MDSGCHRITERLRLEGMSGGHLLQPRTTLSLLPRTMSRQLFIISLQTRSLAAPSLHLPSGIYIHCQDPPWTFSPPSWTVSALFIFPQMRDTLVPQSSSWSFTGPSPVCPCLCIVLESPELDTVLWVWSHGCWVRGKDDLPQPASNKCRATVKTWKVKISLWTQRGFQDHFLTIHLFQNYFTYFVMSRSTMASSWT